MPKLEEKQKIVEEIKEKFQQSQSVILVNYRGLNVGEITELRSKLREKGVDYKVYKNTLMRFAVKEIGLEGLLEYLVGPTAVAFGMEDPVEAAKIINDFVKEHDVLEIKAGMVDGKVIDVKGVKNLAELPPREVLIAKVLGGLNGPISGFANVLQGTIRGLVYALNGIKEQKEAHA
ncbi:50S ribosomal protein L10 [Garciella nitratireducens]|uniref:Large ribosomal subunit protein uL10 n=1 Tax=Garciella nitratireducens DSM 15102 TaxID=1121911 RepID=A0A1T4PU08_9FIRM|nr:50S ribosomal protein L10 [Garciella nitratireducens]RBP44869.1 LSU ribosomal protein L10P [Garciella nitratireducens]SJZ95030.1 LSU ribosomal protein L10P [Garciella nitratireducens DSM 15102]